MRKLIFNDAFDYPEAEHLVKIVDNPDERRKIASAVTESWGQIEPVKNHTLIHLIALGAFEKTGSNLNFDAFEEDTCRKSHPTFVKKASLYRHHNSKVPHEQRDGDVLKSAYNDKMGRVELLIAANNDKCADWLGKLEKGGEAKFSMGWHCDHDICSICGNKASKPNEYCMHVKKGAAAPFGRNRILPDGRKCFVYNREGYWNDISYVDRGADMIAMDLAKVAGLDGSEPIGSAELAEFLEHRVLSTPKLAVAEKLSKIQKYIEAAGIQAKTCDSGKDLSESALRELQDKKPSEMFGALAKAAALLPFSEFIRLSSGSRYQEFEDLAKEAGLTLNESIRLELGDRSCVEAIASIHDFDPSDSYASLTQKTAAELLKFLASPEMQDDKIKSAALAEDICVDGKRPSKEARALVRQYLAYKVAFLTNVNADDEILFNALILN